MTLSTVICIGMAGSGKTTFMQRLNSHLHTKKTPPYVVNLDPAVLNVPYGANIDIRDSINYKKVIENYQLGPNGAIVTSLNLFSTKIDQVIKLVEKKKDTVKNCIIDTPGQIECFVWSASGAIITESFASTFPTIIAYIVDTPRNSSPTTFMSNMLYACSILYKTQLPMIVVFNKTDVCDAEFAKEWMTDFESFQAAIDKDQKMNPDSNLGSGYMGSLINSMSLMLEEFYSQLDVVSVSSLTGDGFDNFLDCIDNKVEEYESYYKVERERILRLKKEQEENRKEESLNGLMKDLNLSKKKEKKEGEDDEGIDVISDLEEENYNGLVDRDEDEVRIGEPEREYSYPGEDNTEAATSMATPALQDRYQEALQKMHNADPNGTASKIAKNITK